MSVVFRNATVLTVDASRTVLSGHDVLVTGDRIAAVGVGLAVPEGTEEIEAAGGIVMPGMIDTHRHMWQTSLRGYGADWTLTQYFVWNYLEWGKVFRPEDIHAGNLLAALEALDAGVTTTVDWSHGLQTPQHADAAVDALTSTAGRFVLAYGNIHDAPANWTADPGFAEFVSRRITPGDDMLGFQLAFDVTGDPAFPERPAFEVARELGVGVTTHAGVWGATGDDGVRLMHEHGFAGPDTVYVHAASLSADSYHRIAATGGSVSVSTESEQSAGQGYPPTWALREHGIPVSLSMDSSMWWSADLFSAMRTTLGADRSREHLEAHRARGHGHPLVAAGRAGRRVGHPRRGPRDRARVGPGLGRGREEGRPGAAAQRPLTGVVPGAAPARPRGVPGPARRRAHGPGGRARGEARRASRRRRPARRPRRGHRDRGAPACDDG